MISVCLAAYNGEKYLREQLDSILCQLSETDELIISDDGSKDRTIEIINSYNDKRIHLLKNQDRHGVVPNFENALSNANGDYIFLSDQDDVWLEGKIEKSLEYLKEYDLVIHNANVNYQDGFHSDTDYYKIRNSGAGYMKNLWKNTYLGCCMAFKKKVLSYTLPFPKNILWHDMWIALMVELKGNTKFIEGIYLNYRRHGDNASASSEKSTFSKWFQFKYRMVLLYNTLKRAYLN